MVLPLPFDRFDRVLEELNRAEKGDRGVSDVPTYVLEREFDAPRELVWQTWTDPELLPRWYGPGVETIVHHLEVKPGGLWLDEMRMGGGSHYERVEYTEVTPPERLVWLHSVCDADWKRHRQPDDAGLAAGASDHRDVRGRRRPDPAAPDLGAA